MRKTTAFVVTAALMFIAGPAALAEERTRPTPDVENAKPRCMTAIDDRLARIDRLQEAVASSEHVTARHQAILEGQLADAQVGLSRLKAQIRDEDDPAELRELCRSIVEDFRIYLLVTPRTLLTLTADAAVATADKLNRAAEQIQTKIDEAAAEGKDVTAAEAEHDSMVVHIDEGRATVSAVPEAVLPLEPSGYPDNKRVLDQARADMREAQGDLHEARQDGEDAIEALRIA